MTGKAPAHILIFPVPLQGHVNSMLNLAEVLCLSGVHVTILLSDYTHNRLLRHASLHSRFLRYSGFQVATISDGLPADQPRSGQRVLEVVMSLKKVGGAQFLHLMESTDALSYGGAWRRVRCLITDGVMTFTLPVVEEMGIPYIYFSTISACTFLPSFCIQEIIDAGKVPLKGISFIKKNINRIDEENEEHMPIGFEVALPSLIEIAKNLEIDIPNDTRGLREIHARREIKLKKIPREIMHQVPTTLLHSFEGMGGLHWHSFLFSLLPLLLLSNRPKMIIASNI